MQLLTIFSYAIYIFRKFLLHLTHLQQLTRQIQGHTSVTNPAERMEIQTNALRVGALLQNLGALLLDLGRTTRTLRIGQTLAEAVVNVGPAVFISTYVVKQM